MFDQAALQKIVSDALARPDIVPAGHRGAFVTVAAADGVKAVIATKVGDRWTVSGSIDHPWSGGLDYGATVQATW